MATVADAVERITKATGLPEARVSYAARHLRIAGSDLWPTGGKGGGKNAAHVHAHHLINLLLVMLAAEQLTQAPDVIRDYRDLRPCYVQEKTENYPVSTYVLKFLGGGMLGEGVSRPEDAAKVAAEMVFPGETFGDVLERHCQLEPNRP